MQNTFSPYGPIRLRELAWWKYAVQEAQAGNITSDGRIHYELRDRILDYFVKPITDAAASAAQTDPEMHVGGAVARALELMNWVPIVGQYELCGRQIFDINDDLAEMFAHTDFQDVTLRDWHPPYDCFYVRFGKQPEIKLPYDRDENGVYQYEYFDGAFVGVTPTEEGEEPKRRIKFAFCTLKENGEGVMMPGQFIDIAHEEAEMPISDAIEAALLRRRKAAARPGAAEHDGLSWAVEELGDEAAALLRQGASLIVNALFYLESVNHRRVLQPGRDTPPSEMASWFNAGSKQHKLQSRLTRDGYALVYLVAGESGQTQGGPHTRNAPAMHWRRGHWRRQHFGPGRVDIKRVWIKPVMVNKDGATEQSPPGHIYVSAPPGVDKIN